MDSNAVAVALDPTVKVPLTKRIPSLDVTTPHRFESVDSSAVIKLRKLPFGSLPPPAVPVRPVPEAMVSIASAKVFAPCVFAV
jgi:hypothetical protein